LCLIVPLFLHSATIASLINRTSSINLSIKSNRKFLSSCHIVKDIRATSMAGGHDGTEANGTPEPEKGYATLNTLRYVEIETISSNH
jgi:hypothetical protein